MPPLTTSAPITRGPITRRPISRRAVLASLPAAAILARPALLHAAGAAEFAYKYANNLPLSHPLNVRAQEAVDRIRTATGGRVAITVFSNNALGSDTDTLSQLRSGAVEFFTLSGLILSTLVPPAAINGIGFAFKDYSQIWPAMDGALGNAVRGEIARRGLYAFARQWDSGYRQITAAAKPIRTPDDLAGFKIRVPPSPLWTGMFRAFGAAPTSINFSETYSALQTHIVDGQENPLAIIDAAKLYEVQKYLSMTNHMWDGFWFLANRRAWEAMPVELRDVVEREFNASALSQRADIQTLNAGLRASLQAKGLSFIETDPEAFRATLRKAGFYAEWREKFGPALWGTLEGAVGSLA